MGTIWLLIIVTKWFPIVKTIERPARKMWREKTLLTPEAPHQGLRATAVSQLPYTRAETAEWLFHQEKATLENAGKCT
jgi:hypothetical protein